MVHPRMLPYYSMPTAVYQPYMSPLFMRAPSAASLRFSHQQGLPRPSRHHLAAAARTEGVRMVDMSHTLRFPHRQPQRSRVPMFQLPRMPIHYPMPQVHPLFGQHPHLSPSGYYISPDEMRLGLHPQFPVYPMQPYLAPSLRGTLPGPGPHTHFHGSPLQHQGSLYQVHPVPSSSATASPQRGGTPSEDAEGMSSPEAGQTGSTIGMSESGHGFQVLPNVKHVPAHLIRGGLQPSSESSSRSSTPINALDRALNPVPLHLQEGRHTPVSERPYSPANYATRGSPHSMMDDAHRDRSGSQERDLAAKETDLTSQFAALHASSNTGSREVGHKEGRKVPNPKKLSLKTGFSRQYSDDLPTPKVITDIVAMVEEREENIEEVMENSDSSASSPATPQRVQQLPRLNGRNAALSSLQLDLMAAQQRQQRTAMGHPALHSTSSSDSASTLNGERPTYAGIVGKVGLEGEGLMPDISQMEPQTPRTPAGFIPPGGEVEAVDPFGILKGISIEATTTGRHAASLRYPEETLHWSHTNWPACCSPCIALRRLHWSRLFSNTSVAA